MMAFHSYKSSYQSLPLSKRLGAWCLFSSAIVLAATIGVLLGMSHSDRQHRQHRQHQQHQQQEVNDAADFSKLPQSVALDPPETEMAAFENEIIVQNDISRLGLSGAEHDLDGEKFAEDAVGESSKDGILGGKVRATLAPTLAPTIAPSSYPSEEPSASPIFSPSISPSESLSPSVVPSISPSSNPSISPSTSVHPSPFPSFHPSTFPSADPTEQPSLTPTQALLSKNTTSPATLFSITEISTPTTVEQESIAPPTHPTSFPSEIPSSIPSDRPTPAPSRAPSRAPTAHPTTTPTTTKKQSPCFTTSTYESIDHDVAQIKNSISNNVTRSHFLGGIVRLVAHDFMDYDRTEEDEETGNKMGADGCIDMDHSANAGLETIWCNTCQLTLLYHTKYSHLSRADFWIAAANAVIRQTSVGNALDLKHSFLWGRKDSESCEGSAERLPTPRGCSEIESVFLRRMGLGWGDAVALMGAHTLGRGHGDFSGHEGTWVDSDEEAQVFDKKYYEAIYQHAWRPRNRGSSNQDWTRTPSSNNEPPKMMLNTDMCLVFNIERRFPCCSNTNGENRCNNKDLSKIECPRYSETHSRRNATEAVREMLGGAYPNSNNGPFYTAFAAAWGKATTNGWEDLVPLVDNCELL